MRFQARSGWVGVRFARLSRAVRNEGEGFGGSGREGGRRFGVDQRARMREMGLEGGVDMVGVVDGGYQA